MSRKTWCDAVLVGLWLSAVVYGWPYFVNLAEFVWRATVGN
jgi:hypothetical protein